MEILTAAATVPRLHLFPNIISTCKKPARTHLLRCSRDSGENSEISSAPSEVELEKANDRGVYQSHGESKIEKEEKHNNIWELFKEAQENILYLNKQRLLAMEELERVKNERDSLLDLVEQFEVKTQANVKRDMISVSSELLLRIDSLVLSGVIGSTDAAELRRLVVDSRGSLTDDLHDIISKNDTELLAALRHFSKRSHRSGLHIIHICTEMSPVISVGSLASYITCLSCALQTKGNLVEVILPKYACLNLDEIQGLREVEAEFYSYFNGQLHGNRIWTGVVYGIAVTFIQPVYYSSLFSHDRVYGYTNDFERFTYFSRASLDYLVKSGKRPDVLHIHNWQTSIVGPLFWEIFVNQGFEGTKILLTCQDLYNHCLEQPEKLALCGLDPSRLFRPDRLQDNNKTRLVNILKGGIVYSNKVIAMSSVHSKGRIISEFGHGLEPTLAIHKDKLVISPWGFDKLTWDPSVDNFIPQTYSADDITGKSVCKLSLQQYLGLPEGASNILVGCICSDISDVDIQKLKRHVWMASRRGVQFVFMGSSQSPGISRALENFQEEVKDENVRFIDEYNEELAHLIISGSDIMLCLSFDDPQLQVPLKAIKYGTAPVPVQFADSGFRNFRDDSNESSKFSQYINSTFANIPLSQAVDEIINNPSEWDRRMRDGMRKDFSWDSECADVHIEAYTTVKRL